MICTVSTVKDSLPNVTQFVRGNLAAGADHMFVFLEGGDRDVLAFLDEHRHVTAVDSDRLYRRMRRPSNLNVRQTTNANRVNYLLAGLDRAEWLFHIDGDECLDIDKERLLALGPEVGCVRLLPKESVSSSAPHAAGYFKRLLSSEELSLLTVLGLIDAPSNRRYFHGHTAGKVGIRPSTQHGLHIHEASLHGQGAAEDFRAEWLNLLHYESCTPEEFLRKWSVHIAAGPRTRFRGEKELVRGAACSILNNDGLDEDQKRRYMLDVYRRRLEDDVPTLLGLGLLERAESRGYRPGSFDQQEMAVVTGMLPELLEAEVNYFRPRKFDHDPAVLMEAIHTRSRLLGA